MKSVKGLGGPGQSRSLSRTLWRRLESLPSADQIERMITREVARAERNGLHFSLVLFRVKRGGRFGLNEKRLAVTLLRRVRLTDEVGWFDDDHLCAVLPDTSAQGARIFADSVCDLLARKGPRPIAVVYSFPFDWIDKQDEDGDDSAGGDDGARGDRRRHAPNGRLGLGDLVGADRPTAGGWRTGTNGNGRHNDGHHDGKGLYGNGQNGTGHNGNGHHSGHASGGADEGLDGGTKLNRLAIGAVDFADTDSGGGGVAVLQAPTTTFTARSVVPPAPAPAAAPTRSANGTASKHEVRPIQDLLVRPMPLWKRAIDVCGALCLLTAASPVLAASALAIKLTSRGPVIFKQRRAGLGGRPFTIFKFRTMCVDAEAKKKDLRKFSEQVGPAFKMKRDPRITRVGALLRKTSVDELPQLFNVLKGDMSLVGPRPLPIDEQNAAETWQQRRLDVTPGLTCIWQIKGRGEVTFAEWVRMDVAYMRRRTIFHDLAILLKTVPAVLLRRGAS